MCRIQNNILWHFICFVYRCLHLQENDTWIVFFLSMCSSFSWIPAKSCGWNRFLFHIMEIRVNTLMYNVYCTQNTWHTHEFDVIFFIFKCVNANRNMLWKILFFVDDIDLCDHGEKKEVQSRARSFFKHIAHGANLTSKHVLFNILWFFSSLFYFSLISL